MYQWKIDDEQIIVIYKVNEKGKEEEEIKEKNEERNLVIHFMPFQYF